MTSEVIIDVHPKEISIALLEDKSLVEYQNETRSASFSVGNIYMAKVKKLMPGLNACFVDVDLNGMHFCTILIWVLNLALTRSISNRYKATERNFIRYLRQPACPS